MTNLSLERITSRIAQTMRKTGRRLEPVHGGGYSLALRLRAFFDDGTTAFVKVATSQDLARFLRTEHHVYSSLGKQDFLATFYGWDDDGEHPLLILEDFSHAVWTSSWTNKRIDAVLAMLKRVHQTPAPLKIPPLETPEMRLELNAWKDVANDPKIFLSTGFCSQTWLQEALPDLLEAESKIVLAGNDFLHLDVRSDNICFLGETRALLVDWNWSCVGNAEFDLAVWLPSLQAEGGPKPETFLANAAPWAASLSGFSAARVGLPAPAAAPLVRVLQRKLLGTALPWAARALGLPMPDGDAPELILV